MNDLHLEPGYNKIRENAYKLANEKKLLTLSEELNKLEPKSKEFVQKLIKHALT